MIALLIVIAVVGLLIVLWTDLIDLLTGKRRTK